MTKSLLTIFLIFSSSAFANEITDTYQWQSPAPTLLNAMKASGKFVNIGQGWNEYAGVLACYNSSTDGEYCTINSLDSGVLDSENVNSEMRAQGTSLLQSVLDASNSTVGEAYGSGISTRFLFVRCYEPVGTGNLNDLPYCQTSTHNEEAN